MSSRKLLFLICCSLSFEFSYGFWSKDFGFGVFGGDNHEIVTRNAIRELGGLYPDIFLFESEILSGASNEGIGHLGSHTDTVDRRTKYWFGNERAWRDNLFNVYNRLQFDGTYERLGFYVHLLQDFQVPAHQKVVFHGPAGAYQLSPNDSTVISGSGTRYDSLLGHIDSFEAFASNNHQDNTPPDTSFDLTILDPKTNCQSKFWLGDGEDGDPNFGGNGAYGRSMDPNCETPSTATGEDWFADKSYSNLQILARRISHGQLYLARAVTIIALNEISKSLPPLVRNMTITGCPVNDSRPMLISFDILENRTPNVTYSVNVTKRDGTPVGDIC